MKKVFLRNKDTMSLTKKIRKRFGLSDFIILFQEKLFPNPHLTKLIYSTVDTLRWFNRIQFFQVA